MVKSDRLSWLTRRMGRPARRCLSGPFSGYTNDGHQGLAEYGVTHGLPNWASTVQYQNSTSASSLPSINKKHLHSCLTLAVIFPSFLDTRNPGALLNLFFSHINSSLPKKRLKLSLTSRSSSMAPHPRPRPVKKQVASPAGSGETPLVAARTTRSARRALGRAADDPFGPGKQQSQLRYHRIFVHATHKLLFIQKKPLNHRRLDNLLLSGSLQVNVSPVRHGSLEVCTHTKANVMPIIGMTFTSV